MTTAPLSQTRRLIGLLLGPILALMVYRIIGQASPDVVGQGGGLDQAGRAVAALAVLMACLWITEAIPIAATALLPVPILPLVTAGKISIAAATAPYAHDLIFLFMGGFLLARAMQEWGLHRRIALRTIMIVGTKPTRLVAGFMLATAFLSMWISNTATVVMMLPIAMSVIELARRRSREAGATSTRVIRPVGPNGAATVRERFSQRSPGPLPDGRSSDDPSAQVGRDADRGHAKGDTIEGESNLTHALLFGIAYAASIGGIGTLIGTPPNTLLAAFLKSEYGLEISFARWMAIGLPLVVVFLPLAWFLLTKVLYPIREPVPTQRGNVPGGRQWIRKEMDAQGPLSRGEALTAVIFVLTAVAWTLRPLLVKIQWPGAHQPFAGLTDAGIAMMAGVVLLAMPLSIRRREFLLTWEQARQLPWGILILFGGGLSLASAMKTAGVAEFIGHGVHSFRGLPVPILMLSVVVIAMFLTHLMSNTATTATFLPILAAVAVGLRVDPMLLLIPVTIAASCAFMLPIATPPNAVIFASGQITIPQMCRAGLGLNLIGIALIMLLMYTVAIPLLGIS